jgi:hypothetical protein
MKNEFQIPPDKPRRILIITTEEKHRELRLMKAMLDMTWEEMLVDFQLKLFREIKETGISGMVNVYKNELEKVQKKRQKE